MKAFLFITALLSATFCYAQHKPMTYPHGVVVVRPNPNALPPIIYQSHDGVARLKDGSAVYGGFIYNGRSAFINHATGSGPRRKVYFGLMDRLTVAGADTLVTSRRDSTVFLRMNVLFGRLLTVPGPIAICDDVYAINEAPGKRGEAFYVQDSADPSTIRRITSLQKLNRWFYEICQQHGWKTDDVFLNYTDLIQKANQFNRTAAGS